VRVHFYRDDEARIAGWNAVRGARTRVPGTMMALGRGEISHDLAQYVIEAAVGYQFGFWGLLSRGATFKSTGRKRTQPGRALIAAHRTELDAAERLAAMHLDVWRRGGDGPVSDALSAAAAQFAGLHPGEQIEFVWPAAHGVIRPATDRASATGR
jgi:hypothetical protein